MKLTKITAKLIIMTLLLAEYSLFGSEMRITWVSDPVSPKEAVLVGGWDFSGQMTVEAGRLEDGAVGLPSQEDYQVQGWQKADVFQPNESAFKFVLPADFQQGIFACRVTGGAGGDIHLINAPDVWWVQGDRDKSATPGGWIRVFGKCLSFTNTSPFVAVKKKGMDDFVILELHKVTPEQLWANVPPAIEEGSYDIYVHNGFGGSAMWIEAGQISVEGVVKPQEKIYNVTDFGVNPVVPSYYSWSPDMFTVKPDSSDGLQKVFDEAGSSGGIVYLPRGVYSCSKMLTVPENITIRGAGRNLTAIEWSDVDPPRAACLYGTSNFVIEDISLYALNHYAVIRGNSGIEDNCGNIKLRRVLLRADRFLTCQSGRHYENYEDIFKNRLSDENRVAALNFGGPGIEIIDCDIYSSRLVLGLDKAGGIIKGNRFSSRPEHWNVFIRGADRLIFEENNCSDGGVSISNVHGYPHFDKNGVRTKDATPAFRASYVYCANNDIRDSYTKDRDGGVNSDYHGPVGLFFGKPLKINGSMMQFDGKFWTTPNRWNIGASVVVTDGKGAGQYRNAAAFEGDDTVILDSPFTVEPDGSSWISVSKSIDHQIYVDNTISDAGNGIFFWCGGLESIACRNKVIRAGTVNVNSIWHTGFLPAVGLQFIDNEIVEGLNWGASYIHVRGSLIGAISYPPVYSVSPKFIENEQPHYQTDPLAPEYRGPMTMMQVIRNNKIRNNGSYYIGGMVNNALLDGNFIADSDVGVEITNVGGRWQDWFEGGPTNILVRGTKLINVTTPIVNKCGVETLIIE